MKNGKSAQRLVWGLALCPLGQYGAVPVCGGGPANRTRRNGVVTSDTELGPSDESVPVPVEMDVNITVSSVLVSLPANGFEFTINPTQEFDVSRPSAQITSPDVTVVNHSVVPIKLEIASVSEVEGIKFSGKSSDYVEQSLQLVDRILDVGPPGTVILILGTRDGQCGSSEDFEHCITCPEQTGIFVAEIPAEQETAIKLCGKVTLDFYGEYEFVMKPALKINATRAD